MAKRNSGGESGEWVPGVSLCREFLEGIEPQQIEEALFAVTNIKKQLENRTEKWSHICFSLREYGWAGDQLRKVIENLLDGFMTLDNWVRKQRGYTTSPSERRKFRIQWLGWMIKQLELLKDYHKI